MMTVPCKARKWSPGLLAGAQPPAQSGSLDDMFLRLGAPGGGGGGGGNLGRIDDDAGAASVFGASSRAPRAKKNGWS